MRSKVAIVLLTLPVNVLTSAVSAQDIPLANWTVPPHRQATAGDSMSSMADISSAVAFVAMQPCRIVDTRGGGVFTGTYGPPIMAAGATRSFDLNSSPHCTGIPVGVEAYSLNFTVTQTAGSPGDIRAWPTGLPPVQLTSVLNWTVSNATLANAIIVPAGAGGSIDVQVAESNTHLLIDINGYFTDELNTGQVFQLFLQSVNPAAFVSNAGGGDAIAGFTQGVATLNKAAVRGTADVPPNTGLAVFSRVGVRGESKNGGGTIGISEATAVGGFLMNPADGSLAAQGRLGANVSGTIYAVHGFGNIHAVGNLSATGTKPFLEPHPTDPTKVIQYVALEGPEAGTYFRGKARFRRGLARISVPDDFRMVTDPAGLTVQITPIGEMATFAVVRMGLDEIVVKSSRDVEFSYLVQGVRASFNHVQPIVRNETFLPESPDARMPVSLAERQKRILIETGVYNADGTVNVETARRLGWDRIWAERALAAERAPGD